MALHNTYYWEQELRSTGHYTETEITILAELLAAEGIPTSEEFTGTEDEYAAKYYERMRELRDQAAEEAENFTV